MKLITRSTISILIISLLFSCKKKETTSTTDLLKPIKFNSTITYGQVTDIEGNTYKTLKIGSKTWMAENLKTSKFNDGTPIQNITEKNQWANSPTSAWCYFDNDSKYNDVYGKLYNQYVIKNKNVCPTGWHIPNAIDWDNMIGYQYSGISINYIEAESLHWIYPQSGDGKYSDIYNDYNKTGFTAIPAGIRLMGDFSGLIPDKYYHQKTGWWSQDTSDNGYQKMEIMEKISFQSNLDIYFKDYGLSIRCVQN